MVKSHMVIYLCTAVEIFHRYCAVPLYHIQVHSVQMLHSPHILSWHTSYTDTLPVEKRILIPVSTSNSVFAVPAPTDGALKYPLE